MSDAPEVALTTTDNPYDPFTQFDLWRAWDMQAGYYTLEYIDRVMVSADDLSESESELAFLEAIFEIVGFNVTGNYEIVEKKAKTE